MPGISAVSPPTRAQPAAFRDASHHARGVRHGKFPAGEIVQEEQRLGASHHQVVHAHGYQVDAHRVVQPGFDGDEQFGADAVGGAHQHRVGEAGCLQVEQRAEAPDAAHHAGAVCRGGQRLDALDQFVSRRDIHARLLVGRQCRSALCKRA